MVQTRNIAKRQKVEECTSCVESVLFNSDSLFKIASHLPAEGLLNLALTCRRFGAPTRSSEVGGDISLSLIEETARRIVQDSATEEQRNALPGYDGYNWLGKYNYLQLLRMPLKFDQLVGQHIEYVEGNKSRVFNRQGSWATAFSNNIMMAGKHYASFEVYNSRCLYVGVMRPGEAMQSTSANPLQSVFFEHFTQRMESEQYNNTVNCCMYDTYYGFCHSQDWSEDNIVRTVWGGMEILSGSYKIGMLLDLDEGTLSVYNNGRKLGVMKRGLAGQYCWVVSLSETQVTIKRRKVPAS